MEAWVRIPGFSEYAISTRGTVVRVKNWRPLKLDWSGRERMKYRAVKLYRAPVKRKFVLHKLIWVSFYGSVPEGFHIDHIDRDRFNNSLCNLRLVSVKENMANRGGKFEKREEAA